MSPDQNTDLFGHSQAIARQVLPFLGQNSIPATPENYMIFYFYHDGGPEMVKRLVDEYLETKQPWTEDTTNYVFEMLFGSETNINFLKSNEKLAKQVKETAEGIIEDTDATAEIAEQTTSKITASLQDAARIDEVRQVHEWIRSTLDDINQVGQASRTLGQSIRERQKTLETVVDSLF